MKHVQCGGAGLAGMERTQGKGPWFCSRDVLGQHISIFIQGCSELVGKQEQPPEGAKTHPKECCDPELSKSEVHPGLKLQFWPLSGVFRCHTETLSMRVRSLGAAKAEDVKFPVEG